MPDAQAPIRFAICVGNDGVEDLSVGMLYRVLPDEVAATEGLCRVVDDSGEDYLYPASRFVAIEVPEIEVPRLLAASSVNAA